MSSGTLISSQSINKNSFDFKISDSSRAEEDCPEKKLQGAKMLTDTVITDDEETLFSTFRSIHSRILNHSAKNLLN